MEYQLTRCELEVMHVVWAKQKITVQEVVDSMERPLAYTTVMTTMKILDDKKIIGRIGKQGRAFIYEPLVSQEVVRNSMAGELSEKLFGGSIKSMVLSLIDKNMSKRDIKELKSAIANLEAQK
jgi:BlaI family transcriptional regulator, penicillinase repressor